MKDRCIYHNLKQDEFEETWELLNVMVGLLKTDYTESDLSFGFRVRSSRRSRS